MKLLYKIMKQDPESREGIIATTSTLGIIANIFIATVKVVIGFLTSSIAIISEGVNNASDVLTSVITLVGSKLAGKHPDEKHPFGYGRIEYLTGLVISVLILVTGIEMLSSSVKLIFNPEQISVSYVTIIIVAVAAVLKFVLGTYTIKMGEKAGSSALEALGIDSRNDSFISLVTIVSALVFIISGYSIDAYAGAITSIFIIKAGFEVLRETISEILGRPGEKELAENLYHIIRTTDGIVGAADMMLHNYGPDAWSGSVNIELDHDKTVGDVYQFLHKLQLKIMHEYGVVMVFGIYAIDNEHEYIKEVRKNVGKYVVEHEGVKSFHAVYLEEGTDLLYCDLVVEYSLCDWDALREDFTSYMSGLYPDKKLELTIETEFV